MEICVYCGRRFTIDTLYEAQNDDVNKAEIGYEILNDFSALKGMSFCCESCMRAYALNLKNSSAYINQRAEEERRQGTA